MVWTDFEYVARDFAYDKTLTHDDFMQFTYYLNQTPNDRNIEFDPKQNLIHDLNSTEQVSAP